MTTQATKNANLKFTSRVIAKRETQKMIKALRDSGITVDKDSCGVYRGNMVQHQTKDGVRTGKTREINLFTAMPGQRGYLVRMVSDLFA